MESIHSEKLYEIRKMGMDFAFDGMNPEYFNAHNEEERRVFLEGYKEGLQMMKSNTEEKKESKGLVA